MSPRMSLTSAIAVLAALALAAPAAAAPSNHFFGAFTDPDFCGTGVPIDVVATAVHNSRVGETSFVARGVAKTTYTNPANGTSFYVRSGGTFLNELVSEVGDTIVESNTVVGLGELFKTPQGPVIAREAGSVTFVNTFVAGELVDTRVGVTHGPHPDADSGFTLFCQIATEQLGLN